MPVRHTRRYTRLRAVVTERYAVHYRTGWESMGQDPTVPNHTRLVALAYARTDENGHARFRRGELMETLGVNKQAVQKLIARAVRDRFLMSASCSECLVGPPHISDRRYASGPCPVHAAVRAVGDTAA